MKTKNLIIFIPVYFFIMLSLSMCKDVFEDDISNDTIYLYTPYDSMKTNSITIDFWWEEVEGATSYNLQVVSPDFTFPRKLLIDTNLNTNYFVHVFYPDTFECRVYAYNSSYNTVATYAYFIIRDTSDLSGEKVIIKEPADNFVTNKTSVTLRWQLIGKASSYKVIVRNNNMQGEDVFDPLNVSADSLQIELDEGIYAWGVRAESDNQTNTPFSVQTITIDTTSPGRPVLISPPDMGDTISTFPLHLSWTRAANSGSAIFDTLFVAEDTSFASQQKFYAVNQGISIDTLDNGKYFWRVKTFDEAGNSSIYSIIRRFIVVADEK